MGSLIREAIERWLPQESMTKEEAVEALLNAEPMEVGDPQEMKREILSTYEKHLDLVPEGDHEESSESSDS